MRRRSYLLAVAAGPLWLAGCMSGQDPAGTDGRSGETPTGTSTPLPEACPTSQDLGIEWPRDLTPSTVATFIAEYERTYYRQVVFEFEPESRFSRVGSAISRAENVSESDDGWRVQIAGRLGIEEAFTWLRAATADPPDDVQVIPRTEVQDDRLTALLDEAVQTGEAERRLSVEDTDPAIDRFEELSEGFEISSPEYSDTLYFDLDGTVVELTASVDTLHVDREWHAWYYVDEQVVRRSGEPDVDPRAGRLLECRPSG